jgi:hypothetical protein
MLAVNDNFRVYKPPYHRQTHGYFRVSLNSRSIGDILASCSDSDLWLGDF